MTAGSAPTFVDSPLSHAASSPSLASESHMDTLIEHESSSSIADLTIQQPPAPPPRVLEPELPGTPPRLIRVHGARNNIHCSLVPRFASSLNKSDCFILDDGIGTLFTWKGKSANMFAKSELQDMAVAINMGTYGGKSKLLPVQQALEPTAFWEQLLNGKGEVSETDSTGITSIAKLFSIPVDSTSMTVGDFTLLEEGRVQLKPSSLTKEGVYALDTGFEIVIYDNRKETNEEPFPDQELIDSARRYKADKSRPLEVRITFIRGDARHHPLLAHFLK